nr:hypothetical protein CFP56_16260 [Quercus suber]
MCSSSFRVSLAPPPLEPACIISQEQVHSIASAHRWQGRHLNNSCFSAASAPHVCGTTDMTPRMENVQSMDGSMLRLKRARERVGHCKASLQNSSLEQDLSFYTVRFFKGLCPQSCVFSSFETRGRHANRSVARGDKHTNSSSLQRYVDVPKEQKTGFRSLTIMRYHTVHTMSGTTLQVKNPAGTAIKTYCTFCNRHAASCAKTFRRSLVPCAMFHFSYTVEGLSPVEDRNASHAGRSSPISSGWLFEDRMACFFPARCTDELPCCRIRSPVCNA